VRLGRLHRRDRASQHGSGRPEQHHRQRWEAVPRAEPVEQRLGRRHGLVCRRRRRPSRHGI